MASTAKSSEERGGYYVEKPVKGSVSFPEIGGGGGGCPVIENEHGEPSVSTTQNKFPGMNSEISWNLSQFPETEEGHSVLFRCLRKFTICSTT